MSASIIVNCCSGVWSLIRITNVGWDGSVVQQRHDLVSAPWLSLTLCQQISARHSDTSYSSQSAEGCICTQQPWTRIDLRHYFELRYFGFWNKIKFKAKFDDIQGTSILNLLPFTFWKCVLIIYSFVFNKLNSYARFPPISKTLIDWRRVGRLEMVPGLKMRVASVMIWCPPGTWPTGYQ